MQPPRTTAAPDEPVVAPVVKRPPGETRGTADTPPPTDDLGSQVGTRDQSPDMNKRV
jgi:hypothetical protein